MSVHNQTYCFSVELRKLCESPKPTHSNSSNSCTHTHKPRRIQNISHLPSACGHEHQRAERRRPSPHRRRSSHIYRKRIKFTTQFHKRRHKSDARTLNYGYLYTTEANISAHKSILLSFHSIAQTMYVYVVCMCCRVCGVV